MTHDSKRTTWIIIAIGFFLWLVVLSVQHKNMNERIDYLDNEIRQMKGEVPLNERDNNFLDNLPFFNKDNNDNDNNVDHNPLDETGEKVNEGMENFDKKEDEFDKKIQMPYENPKTNQNTDVKVEKEIIVEEKVSTHHNKMEQENEADAKNEKQEEAEYNKDSKDTKKPTDTSKRVNENSLLVTTAYDSGINNEIVFDTSKVESMVNAFSTNNDDLTGLNISNLTFKINQ